MRILFIIPLLFSLFSCTYQQGIPEEKKAIQNNNSISSDTLSNTTDTQSNAPVLNTKTSVQQQIVIDPSLLSIDDIKAIKTIDDLSMVYPGIENSEGKNNPNFVTLQRDQILFARYLSQIKDPGYGDLILQMQEIQEGKTLWSLKLRIADKACQDLLSGSGKLRNTENSNNDSCMIKGVLLQEFKKTSEYKEHINSSEGKLQGILESMKKYWSPEMVILDKEMRELSTGLDSSK